MDAECKRLLAQDPPEAARFLLAHSDVILPFLRFVAGDIFEMASSPEETVAKCTLWILRIIGDGDPSAVFEHFTSQSAACGKIWKANELAYKCNTCQGDPTCAICVECFNEGNHEGHDYRMIRTGGGICDCGDPNAWKPEGFCRKHRGVTTSGDPTESLPPRVREAVILCCRFLLQCVTELLDLAAIVRDSLSAGLGFPITDDELLKAVLTALQWTQTFCSRGDVAKRVVALALTSEHEFTSRPKALRPDASSSPVSFPTLLLKMFDLERDNLTDSVIQKLHDLYHSLLTDYFFKRSFARALLQVYDLAIFPVESLRTPPTVRLRRQGLGEYGVQVFTVPAIVEESLTSDDTGILQTILRGFRKAADKLTVTVHSLQKLACDNNVSAHSENRTSLWRASVDLRYCFGISPAIPAELLRQAQKAGASASRTALDDYLEVLALAQGSAIVRRVESSDVNSCQVALEYELMFAPIGHPWVEGVKHLVNKGTRGKSSREALADLLHVQLTYVLKALCESFPGSVWHAISALPPSPTRSALINLLEEEHSSTTPTPEPGAPWLAHYSVLVHPFTLFLPLHRFLGATVAAACAALAAGSSPPVTLQEVLLPEALTPDYRLLTVEPLVALLVEHPLALQVVRVQVHNGLWNRNDHNIQFQIEVYESVYMRGFSFVYDLFWLQCGAVLLGPSYFVCLVAERFKLEWQKGKLFIWKQDPVQCPVISPTRPGELVIEPRLCGEGLLATLLGVVLDRSNCGHTTADRMRRFLIHRLAIKDCTHSELVDSTPKYQTPEEEEEDLKTSLDELLAAVATFVPPSSASTRGLYKLKQEFWKEVDLYY
eukprot:RCo048859